MSPTQWVQPWMELIDAADATAAASMNAEYQRLAAIYDPATAERVMADRAAQQAKAEAPALWIVAETTYSTDDTGALAFNAIDHESKLSAYVKRDGCVEINETDDQDWGPDLHICDLSGFIAGFIAKMTALRDLARQVFDDPEWE